MVLRYSIVAGILLIIMGIMVLTSLKPFLVDQLINHSADDEYFFSKSNLVAVGATLLFLTAGLSWLWHAASNKITFGSILPGIAFLVCSYIFGGQFAKLWEPVIVSSQTKETLANNGVKVEATLKKIESFGHDGYQLICEWTDPISQKKYKFKSGKITARDRNYIRKYRPNEKVVVLIDKDHPDESYWIDLQFLKKRK